ncbi:MAG: hypothetical protein A3J47_02685 [Candidatus Yanofskybacteria bacterium RIFCSPHIGHO2_02_FULL_43_22]|uniref:Uncharacterized protein n=1 Tax=Candidatus Yanofskybacteria bacterium RIFCSPHIGHO2_02_FULL_43_22 TaxID=1802681 RepID=A0A1F8FP64_9BACT|nr:MAG: hypothetical protein A3J47_02685 [Candidatus Yanofskybacteria bacterium RIFCSPHIGHO2_02_FULL_43_22]
MLVFRSPYYQYGSQKASHFSLNLAKQTSFKVVVIQSIWIVIQNQKPRLFGGFLVTVLPNT